MENLRNWLLPSLLAAAQVALLCSNPLAEAPPGPVALIGVLIATVLVVAALGWRRREPVWALAGTLGAEPVGGLTAPDYSLGIGVLIALYSVAVRCGGRVTVVGTAAAVGCGCVLAALQGGQPVSVVSTCAVTTVLCLVGAALGEGRRQWLAGRRAAARRLAGAEEGRRRAADTERHRLARELHDVSAHHLTSVVVTVDAARRLSRSRPELTSDALSFAAHAGRETLTALRRLVTVMRDTDPPDPRPMTGRIQELVAGFSRLGRPIATELPGDLAGPAAEAAFGIIREALTNALRHAPGAAVRVRVRRDADTLELSVENDAPRAAARQHSTADLGSGRGVTGMRERAAAVTGTLTAGPCPDGGWWVRARLPDTTGPWRHPKPSRRRDFQKEQRLVDASLVVVAAVSPLFVVAGDIEDGAVFEPSAGVVLVLLALVHALPLLWRRRAPWPTLFWVLAATWIWTVTGAGDLLPQNWAIYLAFTGTAEAMAVYAVAAYGGGAARTSLSIVAATAGLTGVLIQTITADISPEGRNALLDAAGWRAVNWMVVTVLLLPAVWGAGLAVRARRLRVVAREQGALTDSVQQAALASDAERRRIAAELHQAVLDRTARVVELADRGDLDEVAAQARSALAAMRQLLGSLRGAADPERHHAPQPTVADLQDLCDTLRAAGRNVRLHGASQAATALPALVSLAAYRMVEAALSAGDRGPARVTLRLRRGAVHITVTGVPLAAAGPVADRLKIQLDAAEGKLNVDPAGTLRVTLPAGSLPAPAQEVPPSPYA
ncbi:histidine kinase [Streptomyces sp. NPDC057474]|uniref:sensor histidine kinase n=1 Tax=Streptomyces sp. NPDC057474 TaxID=3346144 RepID=UPI0036BE72E2